MDDKGFEKDFGLSDEGIRRAASELDQTASSGKLPSEEEPSEVLENVTASSEIVNEPKIPESSGDSGNSGTSEGNGEGGGYGNGGGYAGGSGYGNGGYDSGNYGYNNSDFNRDNSGNNGSGANFYSSDRSGNDQGNENKGMSIASMVCGILSVVCCCMGWFSRILGIIAIVFGILSLKNNYGGREMAIAGIATGSCGVALCLVLLIFATIASGLSNTFMKDSMQFYNFNLDELEDIL